MNASSLSEIAFFRVNFPNSIPFAAPLLPRPSITPNKVGQTSGFGPCVPRTTRATRRPPSPHSTIGPTRAASTTTSRGGAYVLTPAVRPVIALTPIALEMRAEKLHLYIYRRDIKFLKIIRHITPLKPTDSYTLGVILYSICF